MSTTTTPQTEEKKTTFPIDKKSTIENHKKIAAHLETAAKHHQDAAKHHDTDSHEKAALSTVKAQGHLALAKDAHKEIVKNQASIV